MRQFKVKAGSHYEDGREYKMGEIVVSNRDLVTTFPLKFDDLGPVVLSPAAPVTGVSEDGWGRDEEEESQEEAPTPAAPPARKRRLAKG